MISLESLKGHPFAFYPLHLEPEISLFIYSRPYLNQIEVIRWIALALPMGWKLVLKEHPKDPYYRSVGYLKKLMEIPNIVFVPFETSTHQIVQKSKLVVTLASFVGFEALCQGRPVAMLGRGAYEFLPRHLVQKCDDPKCLASLIRNLLKDYQYDEKPLVRYVATVLLESVRFNWYSWGSQIRNYFKGPLEDFLEKKDWHPYWDTFSDFLVEHIRNRVPKTSNSLKIPGRVASLVQENG